MKKSISIFLALLLLVLCAVPAFAAGEGITALKINPYGGDETDIDTVKWFASSGKYFLFLPADINLTEAKVYVAASGNVTLDGAPVVSGESAAAFTAGAHTLSCGSRSYPLTVMLSANIPTVYLTTQSGSLDYIHASKENKEPGSIRVYENGVKTTDSALKQIKGRGNSTWGLAKKPYNIKFDKKTALLGMPKAKKWTLLASYLDPQLISNPVSWKLSEMLQLPVTVRSRHIDLYINGAYYGNYILCESVEIQSSRINIHDLEADNEDANPDIAAENLPAVGTGENGKVLGGAVPGSKKWIPLPVEPADVTGGYLLELDYAFRYNEEASGFVTENGQCVVIKSPEYASEAEVKYISAFFEEAWQALHSPTGTNTKGKHYSEYIDTDSLAAMYIVEEISKEVDCGLSSVFVYKDQGNQKLVFAPVWDFDQGNGNTGARFYGVRINDPNTWLANSLCNGINWSGNKVFTPTVFRAAYRQESFRELVWNKWKAFTDANGVQEWTSYIASLADTLLPSAVMNAERWNHYSGSANRQTAYRNTVQTVLTYLRNRAAALSTGFSPAGAMIYYEPNGGKGFVFDGTIYSVGMDASVVAPDHTDWNVGLAVTAPTQELVFAGWNTEADGSGTGYQPGSMIRLNKKTTVLYAIWKTQAELDAIEAAAQLAADKAAFEAAKADVLAAAAAKARPGDSAASLQLIADAKAAITALTYDETHSLAQNKTKLQSILTALDTDLAAQRKADAAAQNPGSPNNGNNSDSGGDYLQWLRHILQEIVNFWRRLFQIK